MTTRFEASKASLCSQPDALQHTRSSLLMNHGDLLRAKQEQEGRQQQTVGVSGDFYFSNLMNCVGKTPIMKNVPGQSTDVFSVCVCVCVWSFQLFCLSAVSCSLLCKMT